MIAPSPEATRHMLKMLEAVRTLLEVAGMPPDVGMGLAVTPEWVTPPLVASYISLNNAIRGLERHIELVEAAAAKKVPA